MKVKTMEQSFKRSTILMDRDARRAAVFASLTPRVVSKVSDLGNSLAQAEKDSLWISYASDLTESLVKRPSAPRAPFRAGLFIHNLDIKSIPVLSSLFRRIAYSVDGGFLPARELAQALHSESRANLFIGGFVNKSAKTITFWRGNLESLTVPFSDFEKSSDGRAPDFNALSMMDCGQTVKMGKYEAAVDAILYERDAAYRRTIAKRRMQEDRSFGAALRRLRKQRGLRREDFEPDVSAKTVARIEQGKVARIHRSTLDAFGRRLAIDPQEIATF